MGTVRAIGHRQRPWLDYAAGLVPWALVVVLLIWEPAHSEPMRTPEGDMIKAAIVGVSLVLTTIGLLFIHVTRGPLGIAVGVALSLAGAIVFVLGPALILIALNAFG
jgi:hypothetical protein